MESRSEQKTSKMWINDEIQQIRRSKGEGAIYSISYLNCKLGRATLVIYTYIRVIYIRRKPEHARALTRAHANCHYYRRVVDRILYINSAWAASGSQIEAIADLSMKLIHPSVHIPSFRVYVLPATRAWLPDQFFPDKFLGTKPSGLRVI